MLRTLLLSSLLFCWRLSFSAVYYVSPAGDDANNGSAELPFRTIGKAESMTAPGDTVNVLSGIYYESITVHNSGLPLQPIVFRVPENEDVTLKAQVDWGILVLRDIDYIEIEGFKITNAHWSLTAHGAGIRVLGDYCTIRNNHIFDNDIGVFIETSEEDTLLSNHDNLVMGNIISDSWEAGIRIKRSDYNKIISNLLYNNGFYGEAAGAIIYYGANHIEILNNTLWNNAGPAIDNYNGTDSVTTPVTVYAVVANNISVRQDGGIVFNVQNKMINEPSNVYSHNLWYNGFPGTPIAIWGNNNLGLGGQYLTFTELIAVESQLNPQSGLGSMEADPWFSYPYLLDFDLNPGSPAFDTGMKTLAELNLTGLTAAADQTIDTDPPDLGFHHLPFMFDANPRVYTRTSFLAYPNPFSEKIRFDIAFPSSDYQYYPQIKIYNIRGEKVADLQSAADSPNNHFLLDWKPGSDLASGIYFAVCYVQRNQRIAQTKIVFIK